MGIFFLLSVLFGEHPHYPSFGGAKSLIRPCWFTAFLIFEIMEISLIQDNNTTDLIVWNIFWCIINAMSIVLCIYFCANHIKQSQHNQWDKLNIATKYEGMLLLVLRTVSLIFVYLDEHEQDDYDGGDDWTVLRQIVITISMYFHMTTLWLLKKPGFHHDGIQFMLKFVTYINAYNLIFSLIFETSHFLQLLMDHGDIEEAIEPLLSAMSEHGNQSYFLVSFSTSFAIAHSNLWFLSQFWEWTQKKSNRFKMSDSKYLKEAIPLETPHHFDDNDGDRNAKQISIVRREQYNTFAF